MTKKPPAWTDAFVLRIAPEASITTTDTMVWHPVIPRFGIRFRRPDRNSAWGKGTYTVNYFRGGRDHPTSIGKVGGMHVDAAIAEALKIGTQVKQGANPAIERAAAKCVVNDVFKGLIPDYLAHLDRNRRTTRHIYRVECYLTKYFPDLYELPLSDIKRLHCADALRRLLRKGPAWKGGVGTADQARHALSSYFEWLMTEGRLEANPAHGVTRSEPTPPRKRTLTEDELRVAWNATGPGYIGRVLQLIILTGCRREQIGELRKEWLDLDAGMVKFPGKDSAPRASTIRGGSKNDEDFALPLSRQAVAILCKQLEHTPAESPYVFGQRGQPRGFTGWTNALVQWQRRCGDAIKEHWSFHDLRRTFVSLGYEKVELDPNMLDACINHIPAFKQGVAGIYQRADLLKKQGPVVQAWADYCDSLTTPAAPLRVVARAA